MRRKQVRLDLVFRYLLAAFVHIHVSVHPRPKGERLEDQRIPDNIDDDLRSASMVYVENLLGPARQLTNISALTVEDRKQSSCFTVTRAGRELRA
jgi:hypothetical protein